MDWRSRGGLPSGLGLCGCSVIMQILPDSTERGSTGGSATTHGQKAARCEWLIDRDLRMFVLYGVIFGTPDGVPSSGVQSEYGRYYRNDQVPFVPDLSSFFGSCRRPTRTGV